MKQSLAWHIGPDAKPTRLQPGAVGLEKHLEDWLTADIDIVASDILVISRQAQTSWGTSLDLLALDVQGNLVIVELKRAQTLRDTVAQAIEYAAWASQLSYDAILALAEKHFGAADQLEARFQARFETDLPETLNQAQRILVVAPSIDDVTETVVNYLASAFKMPINAVGFDVFGEPGNQTLVRHFVREPDEVVAPPTSKKKPSRTLDQLRQLAVENNVGDIVEQFLTLADVLPNVLPYYLTFNLRARGPGKTWLTGMSVYPTAETRPNAVELYVGYDNLKSLFGLSEEALASLTVDIRANGERLPYNWAGWDRLKISAPAQAQAIVEAIRVAARAQV